MMDRSALNRIRGSIGMGQGNIRNQDTRSKDMALTSSSWMNQNPTAGTIADPANAGMQMSPNQVQQGGGISPGGMNTPAGTAQRPYGQPSAYAQQFQRFAGAGGVADRFRGRMGVQGPQYRPGTRLQPPPGTPPQSGIPPKPGELPPTDPPEYGLPPPSGDPSADMYGNSPSIDTYMRRPPYVRPRFGGP